MQLDCHGPQVQGLTVPVMDEDEISPADENVTVLEFYRALDDICLQTRCKAFVRGCGGMERYGKFN